MAVNIHPDFLTFTYLSRSLAGGCQVVQDFLILNNFSTGDYSVEGRSPRWFVRSPVGLMAQFKESSEGLKGRIELGGAFFKGCSDNISPLHQVFRVPDSNITRFDIAIDDYSRRVMPLDVYEECKLGNFKLFRSFELQQSSLRDGSPASTLYLGSKGKGEKLLRVYDASLIHDVNAIRWELQLRRDRASLAVDLTCLSSSPQKQMASFLTGSVDFGSFCQSNSSVNFRRFSWWKELIKDCGATPEKLTLSKDDPALAKMINWVRDQCSPSLGVLLRALGVEDFCQFVLNSSTPRMRQHHYLLVNELINLKNNNNNEDGFLI